MDDDELIASLAGGDDMALRQLFDRHAQWLAARLRKALPPDDGPGLDPAWELSCSMPVSDRLVLLTRAVAVFTVNAVLGLIASAATLGTHASTGTAQLTFAWLLPMTAACALALAVAACCAVIVLFATRPQRGLL